MFIKKIILVVSVVLLVGANSMCPHALSRARSTHIERVRPSCRPFDHSASPERVEGSEQTDWLFFIYMESSDELCRWDIDALGKMMQVGSSDRVKIAIQIHSIEDYAWRYVIEKNALILKERVTLTEKGAHDISEGMKWAVNLFPSTHKALILRDHGFGIIDPIPTPEQHDLLTFDWMAEPDQLPESCSPGACPIRSPFTREIHQEKHRGVMFNGETKTYLTNGNLIALCSTIKEEILNGQKLDILGCDVCKMAMLEVGYQLKEHVSYLIGSQNCELLDGWPYHTIFSSLSTTYHDPEQACSIIIEDFGAYYSENADMGIYTQSATDLSKIDAVVASLDSVTTLLSQFAERDQATLRTSVYNARANSVLICQAPFYTDLHSFYDALEQEIRSSNNLSFPQNLTNQLLLSLKTARQTILDAVVAHTAGEVMSSCRGLSIYFPFNHIDSSYYQTLFAQTSWLPLLTKTLQCS